MKLRSLGRDARLWAFVLGVAAAHLVTIVVNRTTLADWLVQPLLVADTVRAADAIVVPGAGVTGLCSPNLNAVRRVVKAADLFQAGVAPRVLFAGGPLGNAPCAVATVMAAFGVRLGIPADRALVEASSRSTQENAERSAPILHALGIRRIVVVTDRLHMTRAAGSYQRLGFEVQRAVVPIQDGHRDNMEMLGAGLREYAALAYYRWNGWIADRPMEPSASPSVRPADPIAPEVRNPNGPVVLLGASYAAAWSPTIPGVDVLNRGVAGQQSFEMLARFDADVVAARPRAVIIWGFINDIFRSPRESIDEVLDRTRQNFLAMITRARGEGIEVVLATEVTIREPKSMIAPLATLLGRMLGRQSYAQYINGHVLAMNGWLRGVAAAEGLLLLDLEPILADRDWRRRRRFALDDGSHITPEAYEALTYHIGPVLARRWQPRAQP